MNLDSQYNTFQLPFLQCFGEYFPTPPICITWQLEGANSMLAVSQSLPGAHARHVTSGQCAHHAIAVHFKVEVAADARAPSLSGTPRVDLVEAASVAIFLWGMRWSVIWNIWGHFSIRPSNQ